MANRLTHPLETTVGVNATTLYTYFVGNGGSSPTDFDAKEIASVTRTGAGTFDIVLRHAYPTEVQPLAFVAGTAALDARVTAWDSVAKTLTVVTSTAGGAAGSAAAWTSGVAVVADVATLGSAGYVAAVHATTQTGLSPSWASGIVVAAHTATLADPGLVTAVHATTQTGITPAWTSGLAVAADTLVMGFAGTVTAVEATAAGSAGVKQVQFSAAPGAGFVRVVYDANGVATLTFNAADAVTVAAVQVVRPGTLHQGKRIISTGTPQPGEVKVEYTLGVATLTFNSDDAVTAAAVETVRSGLLYSGKKIISTGTPSTGEVCVTYTAGVATLTFAADDAVTQCAVTVVPAQTSTAAAATDPTSAETVHLQLVVTNSTYTR